MNKQKNFLDKVLERILKETDIDYENDRIFTPFSPNSCNFRIIPVEEWSTKTLLHRLLRRQCKNIYGLTDEEINYVWDNYKNILRDITENVENLFKNTTINESEDKQKNFLDKVLERLLKETNITDSKITFPFANFKQPALSSDSLLSVSQWIDGMWENHKYPHRFEKYVNDIYGITYMESLGLWNSYMDIIEKEILKRLRRNKSNVATTWNMGRHDINENDMSPLEWETFSTSTDEEWEKFKSSSKSANDKMKKEREKLGGGKTFFFGNEQFWLSHKQIKFLDKVVAHLLRETEIDYEKWRVNYPFFKDTTYSFQYTLPFSGPFIRYCNNIFPLSKDEMRYVHFIYTGIIDSKIRKYYVDNDIYNKYYNVMGTKDIINFDR